MIQAADLQPAAGVAAWLVGEQWADPPPAPTPTDEGGRFQLIPAVYRQRGPWMIVAQQAEENLAGTLQGEVPDAGSAVHLPPGGQEPDCRRRWRGC